MKIRDVYKRQATDCYAKKDMIIAWGPNKGMTGADANTAGTYDWGNNKTAILRLLTIGIPYSASISPATFARSLATDVIRL